MIAIPTFVLQAHPPRTKKTHQKIVNIKSKNGGRGFTKVIPGDAYLAWEKATLAECLLVRAQLAAAGVALPIPHLVNVRALFYRQAATGDAVGYYQSLGDLLQEQKANEYGKIIRRGAGIIKDDRQIVSWDGSRLLKDAARPRIEVKIEVVTERAVEASLFEEKEEVF